MTVAHSRITHGPKTAEAATDLCPWCGQLIDHEEFEQIQARINAEERERSAELEKRLKAQFAKQKAALEGAKKAAIERERAKTKKATEVATAKRISEALKAKEDAEKQIAALKAAQERESSQQQKELTKQREVLEKDKAAALDKERAQAFKERQRFQKRLDDLQRQLQKKTADELGEGAEIDLFETLRGEFEDDRIKRIDKGIPGADILHDVLHNGQHCGRIIYDSKNRNAWRNEYVRKLADDQLAAEAEHAVLATRVFPADESQLCLRDGVVVANPARVVPIVRLLRDHLVQTHRLRLSEEQRDRKTAALYDFIASDRCGQLLDRVDTLTEEMLALEIKEEKAHKSVWGSRGRLIKSVQKVHADFRSEVDDILEGECG